MRLPVLWSPGLEARQGFIVALALALTITAATGIRASTLLLSGDHAFLDPPMLTLEIPHNKSELISIAPTVSASHWAVGVYWDFLFIAGYVILFANIRLPGMPDKDGHWESVLVCAISAGAADVCENIAMLVCFDGIARGASPDSLAFTLLTIFGAMKWGLVFLTCRALAVQFGDYRPWRWYGAFLRAFATAGAWATILALTGLPARPVIALVIDGIGLVLFGILIQRIVTRDRLGDPVRVTGNRDPVAAIRNLRTLTAQHARTRRSTR